MSHQCYCGDCWKCGVYEQIDFGDETDFITKSDLIANISRGEEALKGIEPGAVFEVDDLFPTQ